MLNEAEAQLAVEAFGSAIDYRKLPGLWRLIYTNAPDVVRTASTNMCTTLAFRTTGFAACQVKYGTNN